MDLRQIFHVSLRWSPTHTHMGIGEILSKILAGGFVGYITNDIAIKMLFEEYFKTRIGDKSYSLGGLIVKKRLEFQASISELVEREVIHHEALAAELSKPIFGEALEKLLADLIERTLPESFDEKTTWAEIPALEGLVSQIKGTFKTSLEPLQKQVIPAILSQLKPSGLLTVEQIQPVADKLMTALMDVLKTNFPTQILEQLLQNIAQKPLKNILPAPLQQEIYDIAERLTPTIPQWLEHQLASPIAELLDKGWEILKVEDFIQNLVTNFAQKPLTDLLQAKNKEVIIESLAGKIKGVFYTDVRQDIVEMLLKHLFEVLKKDETPLYNLLSPQMYEGLKAFLAVKLPPLLQGLQAWIGDKKNELDDTIQTAFRQNAGIITQVLVAIFVGNVGKAVGIDDKIVKRIASLDVEELAQELTMHLEHFLKNNTVGELLSKIPQDKIIDALSPLISDNLQNNIQKLNLDNFGQWFDRPIHEIFNPQDITRNLLARLKGVMMKRVQTDFLYTEKLTTFLQKQFKEGISVLLENPAILSGAGKLWGIPIENIVAQIKAQIIKASEAPQPPKGEASALAKVLHSALQKVSALQLSENQQQRIGDKIVDVLLDFLDNEYTKLKTQSVQSTLKAWLGGKGWEKDLAFRLKNYLITRLPDLTKGRVKALVASSLGKQDDNKLRDMVYKAMGEELAPLNWFGAGLGILTGIFLLGVPTFSNLWLFILIPALAYGITGWGTNWVAVKMLFKPYKPIKIPFLNRNLPFTPGVIAKNKFRFANSMGRFIGDRLLDKAELKNSFAENRERLQDNASEFIQKNDYGFLNDTLKKNQSTWAQTLAKMIVTNLQANAPKLGAVVADLICKTTPLQLVAKQIPAWKTELQDFFQQDTFINWATDTLHTELMKYMAGKDTIADMLPEKTLQNLPAFVLNMLNKIIADLPEYLEKMDWLRVFALEKFAPQLEEWLKRNLDEILSTAQEDALKEKVFEFLKKQLQNETVKAQIFSFLDKRLKSEFSANRPINQVLGGKVMELLQGNLNNWLEKGVEILLDYLKDNKTDLVNQIYSEVSSENSGAWLAKNSIIKTTEGLIDDGIPTFFENELRSLKEAVEEQMLKLGSTPFNLFTNQLLHEENLQERVQKLLENPALFRKIQQLANLLLEERLFKIPLEQLLPISPADLLKHLEGLLLPETEHLTAHLLTRLQARAELDIWLEKVAPVATELLVKVFLSVKVPNIAHQEAHNSKGEEAPQPPKGELYNSMHALLKFLLNAPPSRVGEWATAVLENDILPRKFEDWVEADVLAPNLAQMFHALWANPNLQMVLTFQLSALLEKMLGGAATQVNSEMKDYLVGKVGNALFEALEQNIVVILNSIDFKDIVIREIDKMHARELEGLFYGFAGPYFKFIIGYGFIFGIIFGFLVDFGVFGLLAYLLK